LIIQNDRFLKACRRQAVDRTPVWFMRQAGRYMPEYRAVRERHSLLEIVKTPELAVEVTLQPIRAFELDAAIIFADLLPPLEGMGLHLTYEKGEGPVIHNPLRAPADIAALRVPDPRESVGYTLEAIRLAKRELADRVPLIGFAGAPFTLASYAIEGGGSRDYRRTKQLMHTQPDAWHMLMSKLSAMVSDYALAQIAAGADAVESSHAHPGVVLGSRNRLRERRSTSAPGFRAVRLSHARHGKNLAEDHGGTTRRGLRPRGEGRSDAPATVVRGDRAWRLRLVRRRGAVAAATAQPAGHVGT
jgi:uroporphyrinogen decarboxylase